MSLIVEDGSGKPDADSYISAADASTRLANLGMTEWANLTTPQMEQALRRATQYMEQAYRSRWQGFPRKPRSAATGSTVIPQALSWPRWDVWVDGYPVDTQSVPAEVANACADLAFKAASGDLNADLTQKVVEKGVGPLRKVYDRYSPQQVRYPSIDMALAPFLISGSASPRLVRA